jgi:hypothetical protein
MIWQVLNLKRYSVWICLVSLVNLVRQKVFQLIALMSIIFKSISVDFMVGRIQTFMALEIELIEVGLTSQVIQMKQRLKLLQVCTNLEISQ